MNFESGIEQGTTSPHTVIALSNKASGLHSSTGRLSEDALAILAGIVSAHAVQKILTPAWQPDPVKSVALAMLIFIALVTLFSARRAYATGKASVRRIAIVEIFASSAAILLVLAPIVRMLTEGRVFPGTLYLLMAVTIPLAFLPARLATRQLRRFRTDWGRNPSRRILIVTDGACRETIDFVKSAAGANQTLSLQSLPADASARAAFLYRLSRDVDPRMQDEIWLAVTWANWSDMAAAMTQATFPVPVRLLPDPAALRILTHRRGECAGVPAFELQRSAMPMLGSAAKRTLDIVGALAGLLLLLPLFLAVGLAIRCETPGPVFFRQMRGGRYGHPFRIWKFRTMSVVEDGADITQAKRGDARITAIGAWLRRSSIDELPQLLNVLHGEMSLIGPRPHALAHDAQYAALIAEYAYRSHVKPGLTGWAQINGSRGETMQVSDMIIRVNLDVWYARHWSFALDIRILIQTLISSRAHKAAY